MAYLKKKDWLKPTASKVIADIQAGRIPGIKASTEVFHEIYYVFSDSAAISVILADEAKIATIKNLDFVELGFEVYLAALNIIDTYRLPSIFDAIYAATALSAKVPDHTILSTDEVFDRITSLKRIDPRTL